MWMVAYICRVQTGDSWHACVYLFACVYVSHCGYKLTKAGDCAAHGLLASDPSCCMVWNVIYLHHASPCALKTKIFIELPTTLHYLMTTGSTHCLVVVLLMWLKTSSLWHPPSFLFGFVLFSPCRQSQWDTLAFATVCSCYIQSSFPALLISSVVMRHADRLRQGRICMHWTTKCSGWWVTWWVKHCELDSTLFWLVCFQAGKNGGLVKNVLI